MKISILGNVWREKGFFSSEKSLFENFLSVRGKTTEDYTHCKREDLADPFLFTDMGKAVKRVEKAIASNETILVFGDYDVDGISGSAQLFLTLKTLGAKVKKILPSREDGYGFSEKFVHGAHEQGISLLITTDCGIANISQIALAKEKGIDVIVTDHHSVPQILPDAYAILHPLVLNESFPDKGLTGAGVAFFFCAALLRSRFGERSKRIEEQLLELAVLGTIADCGPLTGENRKITLLGLEAIKKTENTGIQKLLEFSRSDPLSLSAESIAFFLAPRINAAGRLAHPHLALELLVGSHESSEQLAQKLEILNAKRQGIMERLIQEAENMISEKKMTHIILKNEHWASGLIGLIAGRMSEKYGVPTIIMEAREDRFVASCRGPEDFHFANVLREIAKSNSDFFFGYGGHSVAAGFSLKKTYFDAFADIFKNIVIRERGETPPQKEILFDFSVPRMFGTKEVSELSLCEPFGMGNTVPLFLFPKKKIFSARKVGKGDLHLSLRLLEETGELVSAIFFRGGSFIDFLPQGTMCDILATPEKKVWNDKEEVSLKILDIRVLFVGDHF
jgi:single-stranded-DNA-specific exonuclease